MKSIFIWSYYYYYLVRSFDGFEFSFGRADWNKSQRAVVKWN